MYYNDELFHYGRSKRDGAKRGSGRYPLGSGKNPRHGSGGFAIPMDHDQSKMSRRQAKKSYKKHLRELNRRLNRDGGYNIEFSDDGTIYRMFDSDGNDYSMKDIKDYEKAKGKKRFKAALGFIGAVTLAEATLYILGWT